jgi:ribose transport system permease protein
VSVRRLLRAYSFLFAGVLAVILLVANVVQLPEFVAVRNWDENLIAFAPFAILAIASTPSILTGQGGLDLSIAPTANLVNVFLAVHLLPSHTWGRAWLAVPVCLALSTAVGAFNGFLVGVLRYQPVIATLGMLLVLLGLNLKIAPQPVPAFGGWVGALHGSLGPVPWGLILIALPLLAWAALRFTPFHRTLYFVGGNAATAYSAGVNVTAVRVLAYAIGGLFAGVGGLAMTALLSGGDPNLGLHYALIALAAVALGGTPIGLGGRGGMIGSLLGAAVIFLLQNLLIVSHVSNVWLQVAYGAMLAVGVIVGARMTAPPRTPRARPRGRVSVGRTGA